MEAMAREVVDRHLRHSPLLPAGDRLSAAAEFFARPGFDLHEDDRLTIPGDDINFATPSAVAAFKNYVPAALQFRAGEIFTRFPEGLAWIGGHPIVGRMF